jgi:tRNA-Thr(GGU) m(6)t(6)A37 methyltransferase TsaA
VELVAIGHVESALTDPAAAPKQGTEGAPPATVVIAPEYAAAARDLRVGDRIVLLTWLDRARRDLQVVHPRDDPAAPERGVFSTRSADRPNPVGLHGATVTGVDGLRIGVDALEAVHGTPVVDIKIEL